MSTIKRRTRGISLIEAVIYVAFLAGVSALAVNATLSVMKSFYMLRLTQSVNTGATVALERLSREIRSAYDIDTAQSTFNTTPGVLSLKTKDAQGASGTTDFFVTNGELHVRVQGVDQGSLTAKNVQVSSFVVRLITTPRSKGIKIELGLTQTYQSLAKTTSFYDTIELRGSLH